MKDPGCSCEKDLRRLRRKLQRSEENRDRLERQKEASAALHKSIIQQLTEARDELSSKNDALSELTARLHASERRAHEASRSKSAFLANMSHELRTPLNAIIGYSELLLEEWAEPSEPRELQAVGRAGRHLLGLINDILDLSKIEAGRMEVELRLFAPVDLVDQVLESVRPAAARKGLALECHADLPDGLVSDEVKVRQILVNLVSNAVKFTEHGSVRLTAGRNGPDVWFEVRDTGEGMTDDQLSSVFAPFVQADASTTRRYGGTGLGLALCTQFTKLIGGELTAESAPGRGSVFTLWVRGCVPDVQRLSAMG